MDSAAEDAAQHYPQVGGRAVQDAQDGAEDGPRAGNVEKLDEEDLPGGHGHEIHPVSQGVAGGRPVRIHSEYSGYEGAIDKISGHQDAECQDECGHDAKKVYLSWSKSCNRRGNTQIRRQNYEKLHNS